MASAKDLAKRALVTLIRFLAGVYSSTVVVKRDATEDLATDRKGGSN